MLRSGKLSEHLKAQKYSYIVLSAICLLGFIAGCFYSNLGSEADFQNTGIQAEEFIRQAKEHTLSFQLMLYEELSPILFIAAFSLFLPGLIPIVFLIFKWGFSAGFFMTFLIRCFLMKGFFLGGCFLFFNLFAFLPALLVISVKSVKTNCFILACVLNRGTHTTTLWEELLGLAVTALAAILLVALGTSLKALLLPPVCNYLFL